MKEGRPTTYKIEYNEQVYKFCLLGATDAEIADIFGVCVETLNQWKRIYPEFSASIQRGKVTADADVAKGLYNRAIGAEWVEEEVVKLKDGRDSEKVEIVKVRRKAPPETNAASLWLRNRRKKDWTDTTKNQITGKDDGAIAVTIDSPEQIILGLIATAEQGKTSGCAGENAVDKHSKTEADTSAG